jgi:hypothetical protein
MVLGVNDGSSPLTWTVIVVRGWVDGGGIRVRLLGSDSAGASAEVVVASPDDAARTVEAWLHDLSSPSPVGGTQGRDGDEDV